MSSVRKERLEAVPGWVWDVSADQWETGFRYLSEFVECEGHCRVPHLYQTSDGSRLGQWVSGQRKIEDSLSAERKLRLEALPGWVWDAVEERWEEGFRNLQAYAVSMGHSNVPKTWASETGYRLGEWVAGQRKRQESIPIERKLRLEALKGWVWNAVDERWEEGLNYLTQFVEQYGHSRVPQNFQTSNGYRLGQWVSERRKKKDQLSFERRVQLEALPGWAWNKVEADWERNYRYLSAFADQHGHCKVGVDYRTTDGYNLRVWIFTQRKAIDKMPPEQKARLEALPGWVWDALAEQWETNFRSLMEFADREGHCRVPANYRTSDGLRLGSWVSNQRAGKDGLLAERKKRLESVPGWLWRIRSNEDD